MVDNDENCCKWLIPMYQYSCHQIVTRNLKLIQSKDHEIRERACMNKTREGANAFKINVCTNNTLYPV